MSATISNCMIQTHVYAIFEVIQKYFESVNYYMLLAVCHILYL